MAGSKSKRSLFFKVISLVLVFAFSSYNMSFAVTEENISAPDTADIPSVLAVDDIGIAIDSGTVKSRYSGDKDKVIVHIQDAHCNYEAQSNINDILEQLTKECGMDMISVEGAEGIVDTAWFRAFPDAEIRKEVATYFMKKGEITGAEFFSIISDYNGTIFGAETRDYYVKNLKAFTQVYPYKEIIENYFVNTRTIANRLKSIIYPARLKELDSRIRAFGDKELELSDYADYLHKAASVQGIELGDCPNFNKLLQTLEYENKIDFDVVDGERSEYIDVLSKKLSKERMTELVTHSIRFKKGHIKAVDFYSYLRQLAKEHNIAIVQEYPNLFYYHIYTKLYDGIDNEKLFREIKTVETRLKKKLFKNEDQEKLDRYSDMLDMFVDLVNIELTNEDYEVFKGYSDEFSIEDVLSFLEKLCDKYNLNYAIDGVPVQILEQIPNMIDFYEIAMKRDNALIDNTLKRMKEKGRDRCVLIAGGFHTKGIKNLLEKKGISYVVVTPKITKDVESPYIKVLTNQRTSLEDIITESAAMPGVGMKSSREDIVRAGEKMLAPLGRAYITSLFMEDPAELERLSRDIGKIEQGLTVEEIGKETVEGWARENITRWIDKAEAKSIEAGKTDPAALERWEKAKQDWENLRRAYITLSEFTAGAPLSEKTKDLINRVFTEKFRSSPGTGAVRIDDENDIFEELTAKQHDALNRVIGRLMREGKYGTKRRNIRYKADAHDVDVVLEIQLLKGFREAIEAYNASVTEEEMKIPMDVRVHPGTGKGRWDAMYLDERDWTALTMEQKQRLANHEYYHILFPERSEQEAIEFFNDDLMDVRGKFDEVEQARLAEKEARMRKVWADLQGNAEAMERASSKDRGPDIVIIVSSTDEQADFWQNRLTGKDDIQGSGAVVRKDAIVLSVSESNWQGGAGNGLGTLNGYVQAARKAAEKGLIDVPEDASIDQLKGAFMDYCDGKSISMYHTAGKGKRTAPLPGAEVNSKPNIKLPRTVDVAGKSEPVTILESVLMQTALYASSRKDRLSVFWGDQVIINEKDIEFEGRHHIEIFGQLVPLTKDIEAYGVLIPGEYGDCKQREKLTVEEARAQLPLGSDEVYKSIGSFSVSLAFLDALMNMEDHKKALEEQGREKIRRSRDTDPHWWQPLTSGRQEYVEMRIKKDKELRREDAEEQWDKMHALWSDFVKSVRYTQAEQASHGKLTRKFGFKDVGKDSLWWDYGQNKYFLRNLQILTERDTLNGDIARRFFGVKDGKWVDEESDIGKAVVENSVIRNSKIKRGELRNCVVINSSLDEVYAENVVIIGSTILHLNSYGALCYNVVDYKVNLREGQVLANIFHPEKGRIPMRTHVSRDGKADWEKYVYDNPYTYSQINAAMKGLKAEDVEKAKKLAINALRTGVPLTTPAEEAEHLSEIRGIDITLARMIVTHRMLIFGDVDYFTIADYMKAFGTPELPVSKEDAEAELEELACPTQKTTPLVGIDIAEAVIEGKTVMTYRSIPTEDRREAMEKFKELGFGTSGIRGLVDDMVDFEVYTKTRGYVKFLIEEGTVGKKDAEGILRDTFSIVGDRRPSTERIMIAVGKAVADEGNAQGLDLKIDWGGKVPTPAGAYRASQLKSIAVVVTGSHIPFNMNGIKYYMEDGNEVLKEHEAGILENVARAREEELEKSWRESLFDENGMFKISPIYNIYANEEEVLRQYRKRYADAFPADFLRGDRSVFWQHSAVGRDVIHDIFRDFGSEVIDVERSDEFVSVDTERVTPRMASKLKGFADEYDPSSVFFTDGDSDRPGLADENGNFLTGDKLGLLTAKLLRSGMDDSERLIVAVPVSTNDGVVAALRATPGIDVILTKIGSPYVVKAMDDARAVYPDAKFLGWEANGGFLLGSDFRIPGGGILTKLATRDAVLPLLAEKLLARTKGLKLSELIDQEIPHRYNAAGVYATFEVDFGIRRDEALSLMQEMKKQLLPDLRDNKFVSYDKEGKTVLEDKVVSVNFATGQAEVRIEREIKGKKVLTFEVEKKAISELYRPDSPDIKEWHRVKSAVEGIFTPERGFPAVLSIDILDGTSITFADIEKIAGKREIGIEDTKVSHIRPSGNEPVFRNYAMAETQEAADGIRDTGVGEIIPVLAREVWLGMTKSAGTRAVRTGEEPAKSDRPAIIKEKFEKSDFFKSLSESEKPEYIRSITELDRVIQEGERITTRLFFKLGIEGYTWGKRLPDSPILELMDKMTVQEKVDTIYDNLTGEQLEKLDTIFNKLTEEELEKLKKSYPGPGEPSTVWLKKRIIEEDVVAERWFGAGMIDMGAGLVSLPQEVLEYWPEEIYGAKHVAQYGARNLITSKHLTSKLPLSVQIHTFAEMITPRVKGTAYIGVNQDITAEEFEKACRQGRILDVLNEVELEPGRSYIVPAYTPHAYGEVDVDEIKAVTAEEDAKGTISFFDRLKFLGMKDRWQEWGISSLEMTREQLAALNPERLKKDILTMKPEQLESTRKWLKTAEEQGALRKIDMSRLEVAPVLVSAPETRDQARFDIVGSVEGRFLSGEYTIQDKQSIVSPGLLGGRQHMLVVYEGKVRLTTSKGKVFDLERGAEMFMYRNMGESYTVEALEGPAVVSAKVMPLAEVYDLSEPLRVGEEIAGTGRHTFAEKMSFVGYPGVTDTFDRLSIIDQMTTPPVIAGREHVLTVLEGSIMFRESDGTPVMALNKGDKFPIKEGYPEYIIDNVGIGEAVVRVDYAKTQEEKAVYATYDMVRKHIAEIEAAQVDLILPEEMFVPGGKNAPGSALWEQEQLRKYVNNKIRITTYSAHMGLKEAAKRSINEGAVAVLAATKSNIETADRSDPEVRDFLFGKKGKVRVLAIPDIDKEEELEDRGWYFNREVEGTALLLAAVTPDQIAREGEENAADDLQKLMSQLTHRDIPRQFLYYMLSYDEMGDALSRLPASLQKDAFGWLSFLVKNLLLTMPIKPYTDEALQQLENRRKVMWSV